MGAAGCMSLMIDERGGQMKGSRQRGQVAVHSYFSCTYLRPEHAGSHRVKGDRDASGRVVPGSANRNYAQIAKAAQSAAIRCEGWILPLGG